MINKERQEIIRDFESSNLYRALVSYFENTELDIQTHGWSEIVAGFLQNERKIELPDDIFSVMIGEIREYARWGERTYAATYHDFLARLAMEGLIPGIDKLEDYMDLVESLSAKAQSIYPDWEETVDDFDAFCLEKFTDFFETGVSLMNFPSYKNLNPGADLDSSDKYLQNLIGISLFLMYEDHAKWYCNGKTVSQIMAGFSEK